MNLSVFLPIVLAFLIFACGRDGSESIATSSDLTPQQWAPFPDSVYDLKRIARVDGERVLLMTEGGDRDFVAGVNLGATIPGYSPGELAVRREDYHRWFPQIAKLGLRSVRIYTILPPHFYEELLAFNTANPGSPLYLVQGVWIPEERFLETGNLYDDLVRQGFRQEISDAVAAVHGELFRPERPGHASGQYSADVSPWLFAYSIGVELDPRATFASDQANSHVPPFQGEFFFALPDASSTESWFAKMLNHLANLEARRGRTMPLTFTNWPTTDPLEHPDEPDEIEDLVGIDANHIQATGAWPGGFFASYHVYPYYPDFQRHEPGIADYEYEGRLDPYAGYLSAIRRHHKGMPVMITEFGVPSSQGNAHFGPLGRDQGDHTEQEQMSINADLLRIIDDLGYSGGFVFEWVDEWFKFTWNTIEYEIPGDRRAMWKNAWTNEEHFGLLAVEPGDAPAVLIDGNDQEWESNSSQVIFEGRGAITEVRAVKDEGYLYLRLLLKESEVLQSADITFGFDLLDGGNLGLPGANDLGPDADYAVTLDSTGVGQIWVRASNDPLAIRYGRDRHMIDVDPNALEPESGVWHPQRLIVNRPVVIPSTSREYAAEIFEVGALRYGITDPASPEFDSIASWAASDHILEIRLPYMAIGFADPSSLQALRITSKGVVKTEKVEWIGISVILDGVLYETKGYIWEEWNSVRWHERPKAGIEQFAEAVKKVHDQAPPEGNGLSSRRANR